MFESFVSSETSPVEQKIAPIAFGENLSLALILRPITNDKGAEKR